MKVRDGAFLKTLVRISKIPAKIKCVQSMIYVTFTEIQSIIILISDWTYVSYSISLFPKLRWHRISELEIS